MSDFDPDAYLQQDNQSPQQSPPQAQSQAFDPDKYLSQPYAPQTPAVASQKEGGPIHFTPSQLLDPRYVGAVNKVYGLHRPGSETIAKIGTAIADFPKSAGDYLQNVAVQHGANPYTAAAVGEGTEFGVNALEGLPFAGVSGIKAGVGDSSLGFGQGGPYGPEEAAEAARLSNIHARAAAKGFDIPDQATPDSLARSASNNQPLSDNVVRDNFGLSPKADLTPQMLQSWRSKFASQSTFAEARSVPKVQLNDDAVTSLADLPKPLYDRLGLDEKISPSNVISGNDSVDISQSLRARSSQLWRAAKMFPEYEDQAAALDQTIEHVENSTGKYLKDPEQWDLDRAKIAQSYDVQSALDGLHVDVRDLARLKFAKNQIKPWTGDISDLADMGQMHPDAFQLARTQLPRYGMIRKGLAFGAGAAAANAAAKLGMGAISHAVGQQTSNAVAPE